MIKGFIKWVLFAAALMLVANIVPGVKISGFLVALSATLVIGFINLFIKPIISLLALPINILTLGAFTLLINAFLFGLAAFVVPGFSVGGFFPALFGSVMFSIFSFIINLSGKFIPV